MSVFLKPLEGPYDDKLPWPFLGTVTFCLLNQSADDNHHRKKILMLQKCTGWQCFGLLQVSLSHQGLK